VDHAKPRAADIGDGRTSGERHENPNPVAQVIDAESRARAGKQPHAGQLESLKADPELLNWSDRTELGRPLPQPAEPVDARPQVVEPQGGGVAERQRLER
jgi:hypothetical protein